MVRPWSVVGAVLALAPMQCPSSQDPALRRDDSPGDALYALAQEFKARGDDKARRETLQFIVDHYPSSRRAFAARHELQADSGAQAGP